VLNYSQTARKFTVIRSKLPAEHSLRESHTVQQGDKLIAAAAPNAMETAD
jgi:hypothetical protein